MADGCMVMAVGKFHLSCEGETWTLDFRRPPSLLPVPVRTALALGVYASEGKPFVSKTDGLVVEAGTHTADTREFFISGDKTAGILRLQRRDDGWTASLGKNLLPFVLSKTAVEARVLPSTGKSGLPSSLESVVPQEFRYWEKEGQDAVECRDALVASGLFTDNVVKVVDGQLRLCTTRLFLYEPDAPEESVAVAVQRAVGQDRVVSAPCDDPERDWVERFDRVVSTDNLVLLSPADPSSIGEVCKKVVACKDRVADVLIESADTPEAREAMSSVGAIFKFARHPDSVFVASFDLVNEQDVVWLDKGLPSREGVSKPFAGYEDFGACVAAQTANGKDEDAAHRICGALQATHEKSAPTIKRWVVPVAKEDLPEEERFVLGVVLEPEVRDSQHDIYSAAEIRKACHVYMENFRGNTLMHERHIEGRVVLLENYIAPTDFVVGQQAVKGGTWLQAYRVVDDEMWKACLKGDLTGLSIGGSALREPAADATNQN